MKVLGTSGVRAQAGLHTLSHRLRMLQGPPGLGQEHTAELCCAGESRVVEGAPA